MTTDKRPEGSKIQWNAECSDRNFSRDPWCNHTNSIVSQYLDGPCDSPSHQLKLLLDDSEDPSCSMHITAVTQLWCDVFGKETVWLDTSVCVTCFAILWLAVKGEGVSSPSARVSRLTYQTIIGVRYPELVKPTPEGWRYGRYVSTEATLQGGFLY